MCLALLEQLKPRSRCAVFLTTEGAAAAAAGNDSVPTDMLVDTSIPEEPSNPVNPFTSTLLEDDDRPMPQVMLLHLCMCVRVCVRVWACV